MPSEQWTSILAFAIIIVSFLAAYQWAVIKELQEHLDVIKRIMKSNNHEWLVKSLGYKEKIKLLEENQLPRRDKKGRYIKGET